MKNKLFLSILAAFGLAAASQAQVTKFVDVATLGDGVTVITSAGTKKVNATVLTKSQRWTRDRVYILANNVIVTNGITLTIEPGTLIRAERHARAQGSGSEAAITPADPGALVIARGGKLIASGTADAPIIFTSIDDPNVPGGEATIPPFENMGITQGGDFANGERVLKTGYATVSGTAGVGEYSISGGTLTAAAFNYSKTWSSGTSKNDAFDHDGLWGGIVLCGKSTIVNGYGSGVNARSTAISEPSINAETGKSSGGAFVGVQPVEGMAGFTNLSFGGGDEENDDSGVLRFISNRYGGYIIALGVELNSYSLYGVGRNTVLEFLEAYNNADDDFEAWGGDVSIRYSLSAFCGDDGLDTDQGYLGTVQYFVQIQNNGVGTDGTATTGRLSGNYGDSLTENDGPESNNSAVPYSTYTLANATLIGRGYGSASYSGGPFSGPNFKDNAGARTYNSLIMDNPHGAVLITDRVADPADDTFSSSGNSSINRFAGTRTSGGFDAAGRASDLSTSDNSAPSGPDGLYNNTWFFRNGYADSSAVGVNGAYASKDAFNTAFVAGLPASTTANRFPDSHDRSGRGANANTETNRANTPAVQAEITKAGNYNVFDTNPGVNVNPYHRLSGINLTISDSGARTLANSALPSYRGLNNDATFVGAVRDNMWMRGWTITDALGVFAGSKIEPEVNVSANGDNKPVITFGTGNVGEKFVVEVSTDGKSYTKVQTVTVTVAGNQTVTDTARTVGTTPLYYRVLAL